MKQRNLLLFFLLALLPLSLSASKDRVLKIDFKNPIQEQAGGSSFDIMSLLQSNGTPVSLLSYVRAIDAAAQDESISMIYMTPENISAGLSQTEEIRAALQRFRDSGKKIVAYCSDFSNMSYYLASVADMLVLDPSASPFITGIGTQQFFLKDILDTLGIDVQLIRHGKYKSAGEMFVRNSSSEENRLQNQEMVSSLWNSISAEIAQSRGKFTQEEFISWVDNLELTDAESFKAHGLVDEIWFKDQMDSCICAQTGSSMISLVRYVKINRYAEKMKKGSRKNRIAVVYANGDIVMEGDGMVGSDMARTLAKVAEMPKVKAVVFRVNSPGGSSQAAEIIRREVERLRLKKPVYVSYGDYAASGGYWISAGKGTIFTDNTTLTGSIGVFSIVPSYGNALRKNLKVNMEVVGSSAHSDMLTGVRPLSEPEVEYFQQQVEKVYDQFTDIVAEGRGLTKERVDELGQGRVWAGAAALEIGLADRKGGLADAINFAAQELGLSREDYRIDEYPEVKEPSLFDLLGGDKVDPEETLTTKAATGSTLLERLVPSTGYLKSLTSPVIMTRMETIPVIR